MGKDGCIMFRIVVVEVLLVAKDKYAAFRSVCIVVPFPFKYYATHHWGGFGCVMVMPESMIFIGGDFCTPHTLTGSNSPPCSGIPPFRGIGYKDA